MGNSIGFTNGTSVQLNTAIAERYARESGVHTKFDLLIWSKHGRY